MNSIRVSWIAVTLFLSACGHVYSSRFEMDPAKRSAIQTVCVLPLENLTATPEAGKVVTSLLAAELQNVGNFRVLGTSEMAQIFRGQNIRLPPTIDRWIAAELGRRLQAEGVFFGSVTEFQYRADGAPAEEEEEPIVGLTLRLVETQSASVIWGVSHAQSSDEVFAYEKDPLSRVAVRSIRAALSPLKGR